MKIFSITIVMLFSSSLALIGDENLHAIDLGMYDSPIENEFSTDNNLKADLSPCQNLGLHDLDGDIEYWYKGKWYGTDNNRNGLIAIITDKTFAKQVKEQSVKGDHVKERVFSMFNKYHTDANLIVLHKNVLIEIRNKARKVNGKNNRQEFASVMKDNEVIWDEAGPKYETLIGVFTVQGPLGNPSGDIMNHTHPTAPDAEKVAGGRIRIWQKNALTCSEVPYDKTNFKNYKLNTISGVLGENKFVTKANGEVGIYSTVPRKIVGTAFYDSDANLKFKLSLSIIEKVLKVPSGKIRKKYEENKEKF